MSWHTAIMHAQAAQLVPPPCQPSAATRVLLCPLGRPAPPPQAVEVLTFSALPALSLLPSHIFLVYEAWGTLSALPYTHRFAAYGDLRVGADRGGKGCPARWVVFAGR